jgi:hypothetical protein
MLYLDADEARAAVANFLNVRPPTRHGPKRLIARTLAALVYTNADTDPWGDPCYPAFAVLLAPYGREDPYTVYSSIDHTSRPVDDVGDGVAWLVEAEW